MVYESYGELGFTSNSKEIWITRAELSEAANAGLKSIFSALPKEARTVAVVKMVLVEAKEELYNAEIVL